jgi:hypothetical protein
MWLILHAQPVPEVCAVAAELMLKEIKQFATPHRMPSRPPPLKSAGEASSEKKGLTLTGAR